jgi:hypothetical protein
MYYYSLQIKMGFKKKVVAMPWSGEHRGFVVAAF